MKELAIFGAIFLVAVVMGQNGPPNSQPDRFDFTPENMCRLMVDKAFVVDPDNCQKYYQCIAGKPISYYCSTGQVFNKEVSRCVSSSVGQCNNINTYCKGQPKGTWLPDPNSCSGFFYCNGVNDAGQYSSCAGGQNFNPVDQTCEWPHIYPCYKNNDMQPICSYVKNDAYFGVGSDCKDWAVCENGQYISGTCTTGLFDLYIGECNENVAQVRCATGNNPQSPIKDHVLDGTDCSSWTDTWIADEQMCSGYYYCNVIKKAMWGQCNGNKFFNRDTKRCDVRSNVRCNSDNICENTADSKYQWVNDPSDCHKYFTCKDNTRSAVSIACNARNPWFNQETQRCTPVEPTYPACSAPAPPGPPTGGPPVAPGPDAPGPDAPGPDAPQPDPPAPEAPRPDPPAPEAPGPNPPAPEAPRPDPPAPEAPGPEAPAPEAPRPDPPGPASK